MPFVPAWRDVARIGLSVPVEVLAEQAGQIAFFLQADGNRVFLKPLRAKLLEASVRRFIVLHLVVVGVEAGKNGSPGRAAQRLASEGVVERGAFFYQQRAQVGHLLGRGVVQVVGEDEDDVWFGNWVFHPYFLDRLGSRA